MNRILNIVSVVSKALRENSEPFFYLAPEIIGSVNNPIRNDKQNIVILKLDLIDGDRMDLIVPNHCYDKWKESNPEHDNLSFVNTFLSNARSVDNFSEIETDLNEIVDEYGDLFNDTEDEPANIRSSPGQSNHKSGEDARNQYISRYQRLISPLGYGGVVW